MNFSHRSQRKHKKKKGSKWGKRHVGITIRVENDCPVDIRLTLVTEVDLVETAEYNASLKIGATSGSFDGAVVITYHRDTNTGSIPLPPRAGDTLPAIVTTARQQYWFSTSFFYEGNEHCFMENNYVKKRGFSILMDRFRAYLFYKFPWSTANEITASYRLSADVDEQDGSQDRWVSVTNPTDRYVKISYFSKEYVSKSWEGHVHVGVDAVAATGEVSGRRKIDGYWRKSLVTTLYLGPGDIHRTQVKTIVLSAFVDQRTDSFLTDFEMTRKYNPHYSISIPSSADIYVM